MSTQIISGFAVTNMGGAPLLTTITDGSDSQELKTNSTYTVTSQSLGTFLEGATLTHLKISAATGIAYAGVLRNGQYIAVCDALGSNALGSAQNILSVKPAPIVLIAGDQIIVRSEA